MKISIIVPSYGRPKTLEDFLKSLKKTIPKNFNFQIIVVVNDDTSQNIQGYFNVLRQIKIPGIEPLIFQKKLGSVGARNEGIKKVKGGIIFFFDDDTEIIPGYFEKILPLFKEKNIGAVGGAEIKKKSSTMFHSVWFSIRKPGTITPDGDIISNYFYDRKSKPLEVDSLHGSNLAITKEALKKIKFWDKDFYGVYRDETDFTYRIKKAGYKILFNPATGVIHKETVQGGNVPPQKKKQWAYWYFRNTSYFFFKNVYNGNPINFFSFLCRELIYGALKVLAYKNPHFILQYPKIFEGYFISIKNKRK